MDKSNNLLIIFKIDIIKELFISSFLVFISVVFFSLVLLVSITVFIISSLLITNSSSKKS